MINDIQNKNSAQAVDSWAHDEVDYFVSNWPISDQDALKDMEDKIKTDLHFRKQVVRSFFINRFFILYLILICYYIQVSELARIGGKSLPNMIYKILKKVFDDNILIEFTYYGLRNKDNFSLLAINKVIIGKFYICEFLYYVDFELE